MDGLFSPTVEQVRHYALIVVYVPISAWNTTDNDIGSEDLGANGANLAIAHSDDVLVSGQVMLKVIERVQPLDDFWPVVLHFETKLAL